MKKATLILLVFGFSFVKAQKDTLPYNRKAEVIHDGKRYRKYNNYLTFGVGKAFSEVRTTDQNVLNVDYHFHLAKEYFQLGFFMSGDELLNNNHAAVHVCYGKRYETKKLNIAGYAGPSYAAGSLKQNVDTSYVVSNYESFGGYVCVQGIYKLKYDVGLGLELFADLYKEQQLYGVRFIVFFSGGYRGPEKAFHLKTSPK